MDRQVRRGIVAPARGGNEFAPMSSVLLRTESASSSQIENITARGPPARVGRNRDHPVRIERQAGSRQRRRHATRCRPGRRRHPRFNPRHSRSPHARPAPHRARPVPRRTGVYRRRRLLPHGTTDVAPHHTRVPRAIDDLCQFTRRTNIPLIAHAAIAHARFETIHPFSDGNGRTGRALVHAMLKRGNATTRTTVPIPATCSATLAPTTTRSPPTVSGTSTRSSPGPTTPLMPRFLTAAPWPRFSAPSTRNGRPNSPHAEASSPGGPAPAPRTTRCHFQGRPGPVQGLSTRR